MAVSVWDLRRPRSALGGWRPDGAFFVAIAVLLSFALPSRLVVAGLGAAGRPTLLLGAAFAAWWLASRFIPGLGMGGAQPLRIVGLCYFMALLIAYGAGLDRGLPGAELTASNRSLIRSIGLIGLLLLVADGVTTRARLDALLKTLVGAGAIMAAIGSVQYLFHINVTPWIRVPGLVANGELIEAGARGEGFSRVAGTAGHFIEFGVLLAMLVPLALHYARYSDTKARRYMFGLAAAFLTVSSFYSISRSAVLALITTMLFAVAGWSARQKVNGAVTGLIFLVLVQALQPGLLGTLRSLFRNPTNDPSVQGRTKDFEIVGPLVAERPWLGRGPGTYSPDRYTLLDNQWLGTLISSGLLGVMALLALVVTAFVLAKRVGRWAEVEEDRHLGHAIAGPIAAVLVVSMTFDSMGFATFATLAYVLMGAAGALWRLAGRPAPSPVNGPTDQTRAVT